MAATLETRRGVLHLPTFMPDATRAVVRGLDAEDLRSCGTQGLVVNAFHLSNHPGTDVVRSAGGVHAFMDWRGPVMSDSGGFQVFSLLDDPTSHAKVTTKGFQYRLDRQRGKKTLTPEKCIRSQFRLAADILVCLDHCTHPEAPAEVQRTSVENTVRWAEACRETFDRITERTESKPLLFAAVQGGNDAALRRECAERLFEIGFDGYGFGGWPITDDGRLVDMVHLVAELIGPDKPKWALGIGKPEHVVTCAAMGYTLFDCAMPTRDARHGRLYAFRDDPEKTSLKGADFYRRIYPLDDKHTRSREPIDPWCDCLCCTRYQMGYLHHLFRIRDTLAYRLATIHNLRFYNRLTACIRTRGEKTDNNRDGDATRP